MAVKSCANGESTVFRRLFLLRSRDPNRERFLHGYGCFEFGTAISRELLMVPSPTHGICLDHAFATANNNMLATRMGPARRPRVDLTLGGSAWRGEISGGAWVGLTFDCPPGHGLDGECMNLWTIGARHSGR